MSASKARNKVLTQDLKSLKAQLSTLYEKGKHDDELVAALLVSKIPRKPCKRNEPYAFQILKNSNNVISSVSESKSKL